MDEATYRADSRPSVTQLAKLLQMPPLHAKTEWEKPPTDAMKFGTAVHTAILEGDEFESRYAVRPKMDKRTKAGKAAHEEFEASLGDRLEISQADYNRAIAIADAVEQTQAWPYIERMDQIETPLFGRLDGLAFKGRPDGYCTTGFMRGVMIEVKTTSSLATKQEFERAIANYGYGFQAAGYRMLAEQNDVEIRHTLFVVCETKPPFGVGLFRLSDEVVEWYIPKVLDALEIYRDCLRAKSFPSHPNEIQEVGLPAWHEGARQLA